MNGESFIVTMQTGGIPLFLPCVTIALVAVFVAVYSVRSILKNEELRTWFLAALLVLAVPTAPLVLYNSSLSATGPRTSRESTVPTTALSST